MTTAAIVASIMTRTHAEPHSTAASESRPRATSQPVGHHNTPLPIIRFVPHHDPRATRPSLSFTSISRTLPTHTSVIRVGRYSERDGVTDQMHSTPSASPVGFKSKVVSRKHCEFWCENGQWLIRDVKSSSGTFLNHVRLSPPNVESKPWQVHDGDLVQLGIDFKGGEEAVFRCVKMRVELNRGWQKTLNNFNKATHQRLRNLAKPSTDPTSASSDCSICLLRISPCQSLFVAPCSHVWHYKCIRRILNSATYPHFPCPNCRAVADLEAEIEDAELSESDDGDALQTAIQQSLKSSAGNAQAGASSRPEANPNAMDYTRLDNADGQKIASPPTVEITNSRPSSNTPPSRPESRPGSRIDTPEPMDLSTSARNRPDSSSDNATRVGLDVGIRRTAGASNSGTEARSIPIRSRPTNGDLVPGTAGVTEGLMTPRNDAGPFVLDGGAGRLSAEPQLAGDAVRSASVDRLAQMLDSRPPRQGGER